VVKWALALAAVPALAQLPPSGALSDSDRPLFQAEVARLEKLLDTTTDKAAVTYELARVQGWGKQWPEAVQWLQKAVDFRAGFDPSRDSVFTELRSTREFEAILAVVREATPPVLHSTRAFTIAEGDLVPESMAWDPASRRFYFGSMRKGKIVRCSPAGECATFAEGLGVVLGLKVSGRTLWALSNSNTESALLAYDLPSGRLLHRNTVTGPGHNFNDLAIAPAGDVYFTDTRAAAVWRLRNGALEKLPGRFNAANGIAISPDGRLLYVSTFPDGITVVNLKTGAAAPIARPANFSLAMIDGLYFDRGSLIAIQNGYMTPRVIRCRLRSGLRAIESCEVLERRNPLFDGITTGVIVDGQLYYMANIQDDKESGFNPITILKLRLGD
jgi:sugar lactone lactonase YvrE